MRRFVPRSIALFTATAALCGCAAPSREGPVVAAAPASGESPGPAASRDEIARLVLDAASRDACARVRGKFVGLPGPSALSGADAGLAPAAGRWWVRSCTSRVEGGSLRMHLVGPGWTWVDQAASGFRVAQHVHFSADVELSGSLDVGYDERARVATVWLTPTSTAEARVEPLNEVNARPDALLASIASGASFGLVERLASAAAQKKVGEQGAAQFRATLAEGATITFDLASSQLDLMVGKLPRGVVPRRPFAEGGAWVLNERQTLSPGGLQVAGPFDASGAMALDARLEHGDAFEWRVLCQRDAEEALDGVARGLAPAPPRATPGLEGRFAAASPPTATFVAPACPWVLVTHVAAGAPSTVALRLRRDGEGGAPAAEIESLVVKVVLVSFAIQPKKPGGASWDPFGGAPDPRAWISTGRVRHVLVDGLADTLAASPAVGAPEPLEVTRARPLTIGIDDVDVGSADDPVGSAWVTLDELVRAGGELDVDLRLGGVKTATAHLRYEIVGRK